MLTTPNQELGAWALRLLENKLADIRAVVPADRLKKQRSVTIVLDLTQDNLGPVQYHPGAGWLKAYGYSTDLAKCVHLPCAALGQIVACVQNEILQSDVGAVRNVLAQNRSGCIGTYPVSYGGIKFIGPNETEWIIVIPRERGRFRVIR